MDNVWVWHVFGVGICQCLVIVSWYADVACAVVVVPFDGHATEKRARSVNRDFIPLLQCFDDVNCIVDTNIFNATIMNH